jgi:cbb3-type cytochrome oxidase maturation protein
MKIIFVLILVSLVIALGFLGAFLWAVKSGQYDDDYTPSVRMLFDDEKPAGSSEKSEPVEVKVSADV